MITAVTTMIKIRFCLTTRLFVHISYVAFHKLRHRKKTQHVKTYPQHRSKLLTMNGISFNLSLFCRVAQEGNWPPRIRSCSRQGFISHASLDAHTHTHKANPRIQRQSKDVSICMMPCSERNSTSNADESLRSACISCTDLNNLVNVQKPYVSFQTEACHQHDCFKS